MTRYTKNAEGHYLIKGHKYEILEGSRAQVHHGTAYKTSGGLTKEHLLQNKNGRIVSKKKHTTAKREKRLVRAGYGTKKGHFGAVKIHNSSKKSRSMKGGKYTQSLNSSPEEVTATHNTSVDLAQTAGKRRRGSRSRRHH
jgi:hypothetical protein